MRRTRKAIIVGTIWLLATAGSLAAHDHGRPDKGALRDHREEPATLTNVYRNPLFAEPERGDYHLQSSGGRYVLAWDMFIPDVQTSPCVDAADLDGDINVEPLPNGGRVNMGAYGGTFYASLSSPNLRPTVSITGWGRRSNLLRLTVDAQDPDGEVVRVEFYADGVKVAEDDDGTDGWFAEWPTEEGTFDVVAVAEDNEGARTISETRSLTSQQGGGRNRSS